MWVVCKSEDIARRLWRYNETIMKALICHDSEDIEMPTVFAKRELDEEESEIYRLDPATRPSRCQSFVVTVNNRHRWGFSPPALSSVASMRRPGGS